MQRRVRLIVIAVTAAALVIGAAANSRGAAPPGDVPAPIVTVAPASDG